MKKQTLEKIARTAEISLIAAPPLAGFVAGFRYAYGEPLEPPMSPKEYATGVFSSLVFAGFAAAYLGVAKTEKDSLTELSDYGMYGFASSLSGVILGLAGGSLARSLS